MYNYEELYRDQIRTILSKGKWIYNERTGTRCLTIPRYVAEYQLDPKTPPLLNGRPSYPVSAVAEIIGYLRRYEWANQFASIGSNTWSVNANETQAWLDNKNRKGHNHVGQIYGAAVGEEHIRKVLDNLSKGIDDRGLVLNWWIPDTFDKGCLRPCVNQHQFTIVGNELHVTSTQRSTDMMCGKNYNSNQVYFLGMLGTHLAGKDGGTGLHIMNHLHIYEDHLDGVEEYLARKIAYVDAEFKIADWVRTAADIMDSHEHAREYFSIEGYKGTAQPKIDFKLIA